MERGGLFPARMLGFGFYWAWLFLTCVSPSLIADERYVIGLPLEATELFVRLVFVIVIVVTARALSPALMERILFLISLIAGAVASLMLISGTEGLSIPMIICMGAADASLFMLWLCFFGNDRVGEVAVFLAASYALGAAITIVVSFMPEQMTRTCAVLLPLLSCISFKLSAARYATAPDSSYKTPLTGDAFPFRLFPSIGRLCGAIALYALIFGMMTSTLFANGIEVLLIGPAIEAPCCLFLGVILALLFWKAKDIQAVYRGYRIAPLLLVAGIVLFLIPDAHILTGASALVMLGYLLFEMLALNDLCNDVKLYSLSPLEVFGVIRIAITCGMVIGWLIGTASPIAAPLLPPLSLIVTIGAPAVIVASTLLFTEKEVFAVRSATYERIDIEKERASDHAGLSEKKTAILQEASAIESELVRSFGTDWKLSKREMEVLPLLLQGKTAVYISEQLYIAPGTTKTHIYNIYQKLGIHTKMELLDMFASYRDSFEHDDDAAE